MLGKVIAGLVRTGGDLNHRDVPFRDSKLTKLLISSLGGHTRTLLVACVTEASGSQIETLRTLKFSMSCACIRNKPKRFLDPQVKLVLELRDEIKRLRDENKQLRSSILTAPSSQTTSGLGLEVQHHHSLSTLAFNAPSHILTTYINTTYITFYQNLSIHPLHVPLVLNFLSQDHDQDDFADFDGPDSVHNSAVKGHGPGSLLSDGGSDTDEVSTRPREVVQREVKRINVKIKELEKLEKSLHSSSAAAFSQVRVS